jgi:hypothetical protein
MPTNASTIAKIGVLEFRYGNSLRFKKHLQRTGSYAINIGDWIQSFAVESLVKRIRGAEFDITRIDRDSLPSYQGPPVKLIMNACFTAHCFPLPSQIEPIFIGFQTSNPELIREHVEFFTRHQPIGCRDTTTRDLFLAQGVNAYVTGCLTMSLPKREVKPQTQKTFLIRGSGAGEMPKQLRKFYPPSILQNSIKKYQREQMPACPLRDEDVRMAMRLAEELLKTYQEEASLVVTPLLHAAGPCIAMGIPVILARKDYNDRFTAISRVLPIHTPRDFTLINWNPQCPDLSELKECLQSLVMRALEGNGPSVSQRNFLKDFYEKEYGPTHQLVAARETRESLSIWRRLPLLNYMFRA